MYCKGRLGNADKLYPAKYPQVPSPITTDSKRCPQLSNAQRGEGDFTEIRSKYWIIIRGRQIVRMVVQK